MTVARHEFTEPSAQFLDVVLGAGRQMRCRHVVVRAGDEIPLRGHFHRTINLMVAQGGAEVRRGDEVTFLHQEDSILIPVTTRYSVRNPGRLDLHLVVIETGAYLEDDDHMPADAVSASAA